MATNSVELLEWPPQSPDLSYIEHLWDWVDRHIPLSQKKPVSSFRNAIFETWNQIPQELIDNLIESIPRRLEEVIKSNGGSTKY